MNVTSRQLRLTLAILACLPLDQANACEASNVPGTFQRIDGGLLQRALILTTLHATYNPVEFLAGCPPAIVALTHLTASAIVVDSSRTKFRQQEHDLLDVPFQIGMLAKFRAFEVTSWIAASSTSARQVRPATNSPVSHIRTLTVQR